MSNIENRFVTGGQSIEDPRPGERCRWHGRHCAERWGGDIAASPDCPGCGMSATAVFVMWMRPGNEEPDVQRIPFCAEHEGRLVHLRRLVSRAEN